MLRGAQLTPARRVVSLFDVLLLSPCGEVWEQQDLGRQDILQEACRSKQVLGGLNVANCHALLVCPHLCSKCDGCLSFCASPLLHRLLRREMMLPQWIAHACDTNAERNCRINLAQNVTLPPRLPAITESVETQMNLDVGAHGTRRKSAIQANVFPIPKWGLGTI